MLDMLHTIQNALLVPPNHQLSNCKDRVGVKLAEENGEGSYESWGCVKKVKNEIGN